MRIAKAVISSFILILCILIISNTATARQLGAGRFQTFEDLALSVGKLNLDNEPYTGGAVTINGGLQYSVLGVYIGLGPTLFVPQPEERQRQWNEYIGGVALAGVMLRIPLKNGMIIAGNEFILGAPYQPLVGYLFRGRTRHAGIFITGSLGSSGDNYYGAGVRMTLAD